LWAPDERTRAPEIDGYFPLLTRISIEISRFDTEVLYVTSLWPPSGPSDIGQLGGQHIVKQWDHSDARTTGWRAVTANGDERRAAIEVRRRTWASPSESAAGARRCHEADRGDV
jgi:hypothetical protein